MECNTKDLVLTVEQQVAYDRIEKFTSDRGSGMLVLGGYAGTGKTFLVSRFLQNFQRSVLVSAPTHKAVKVLKKFGGGSNGMGVAYSTVHSALGMKEVITPDGKQTFKKDRMYPDKVNDYGYMVVDEVSMLSDDLFKYLLEYVERGSLKLIFVGDPLQIPPIGKDDCIPFDKDMQMRYDMQVNTLKNVVRQAVDNPIIKLSMSIRDNIKNENVYGGMRDEIVNESGVQFLRGMRKEEMWDVLYPYFTSDNFKDDPDYAKVIAWTNRTVDYYNNLIRRMIYGQDVLPRIMKGEMLIADSPIMEDGTTRILFTTNEEMEVMDYTIKEEDINHGQFMLKYYDTKVVNLESERESWVRIIHEDSMETYKEILNMLKEVALSHQGNYKAVQCWREYYEFQENFASVKYNYAITAHKSQGSTYDYAFVIDYDMNLNKKLSERNRIKYTACTRPRKILHIVL